MSVETATARTHPQPVEPRVVRPLRLWLGVLAALVGILAGYLGFQAVNQPSPTEIATIRAREMSEYQARLWHAEMERIQQQRAADMSAYFEARWLEEHVDQRD